VDSWLLVGGSQIANLTPNPSFGHNLCFTCLNWLCEPISEIKVPRAFQRYKEHQKPMNFDPYNCSLKIWESIWDSDSHNGSSFGSVRVHSLTLFCTPWSMRCDFRASFLARNLVSPCLNHKPNAKVTTINWWHPLDVLQGTKGNDLGKDVESVNFVPNKMFPFHSHNVFKPFPYFRFFLFFVLP
jgi:hypothetical protein